MGRGCGWVEGRGGSEVVEGREWWTWRGKGYLVE